MRQLVLCIDQRPDDDRAGHHGPDHNATRQDNYDHDGTSLD